LGSWVVEVFWILPAHSDSRQPHCHKPASLALSLRLLPVCLLNAGQKGSLYFKTGAGSLAQTFLSMRLQGVSQGLYMLKFNLCWLVAVSWMFYQWTLVSWSGNMQALSNSTSPWTVFLSRSADRQHSLGKFSTPFNITSFNLSRSIVGNICLSFWHVADMLLTNVKHTNLKSFKFGAVNVNEVTIFPLCICSKHTQPCKYTVGLLKAHLDQY